MFYSEEGGITAQKEKSVGSKSLPCAIKIAAYKCVCVCVCVCEKAKNEIT